MTLKNMKLRLLLDIIGVPGNYSTNHFNLIDVVSIDPELKIESHINFIEICMLGLIE